MIVTKRKTKNLGGRPRVHKNNAAKQKAYRGRLKERRRANSKPGKQGR